MADARDELLEHEYDGIREYDNPLPRWWVWLFYGTIVFAAIYFPYYVSGWGPTMDETYLQELAQVEQSQQALAAATATVSSGQGSGGGATGGSSSTNAAPPAMASLAGDPAAIEAGQGTFAGSCLPCHGDKGQGIIGPNLTDNHWIHGNTYADLVNVISNGVPDKGMLAWKAMFNPRKINELAAYVLSLKGSNPPNPKAPEGQLYPD